MIQCTTVALTVQWKLKYGIQEKSALPISKKGLNLST